MRNQNSTQLSKSLGKSKDYLCSYRKKNNHIHNYEEAYNEVIARREIQDKVFNDLNIIYYKLIINRGYLRAFGKHLVDIKIYTHINTLSRTLNKSFKNRGHLVDTDTIKVFNRIVYEYEKWSK